MHIMDNPLSALLSQLFQVENIYTLWICCFVFLSISWFLQKPNLPGPRGWPFIDSLPTLLVSLYHQEHPHELMSRLCRQYGKIFSFGIGGKREIVVLSDYQSIKEAFGKAGLTHRAPALGRTTAGVLFGSGDVWNHQRSFCVSFLRHFGVSKSSFDEQIAIEATQLCDKIAQSDGKPFEPRRLLTNATSNIICTLVMGQRFDYDDEDFHKLLSMLNKRVTFAGAGGLLVQTPFIRLLRWKKTEEYLKILTNLSEYFIQVIQDHKKRFENTHGREDIIDLYLKEIQNYENKSEKPQYVGESHLCGLIDNLFLAGTETSSNALAWCLLHVIADPEVQQHIRDEIAAVCGSDRMPKYSDKDEMPFTEAVIMEVQRLHTIVPLGVAHYADKDTEILGYRITKGTRVLSNLWAVHHDPDIWEEPNEFKPSRFLDENGKLSGKEEWIPFSIGRRVCLGEKLARMEIFIFLTHLLCRFSLKKPTPTTKLSFEGRSGGTYSPHPYEICADVLI